MSRQVKVMRGDPVPGVAEKELSANIHSSSSASASAAKEHNWHEHHSPIRISVG